MCVFAMHVSVCAAGSLDRLLLTLPVAARSAGAVICTYLSTNTSPYDAMCVSICVTALAKVYCMLQLQRPCCSVPAAHYVPPAHNICCCV
jgi:hypothetical protein